MRLIVLVATAALAAAGLCRPAVAETELKLALVTPPNDGPEWKGVNAFKDYLEFRTAGAVKVRLFPSGQLGSGRNAVEAVQQGLADIYLAADGDLAGFYPKIAVFSIPYVFPSSPVAWAVFSSPFAARMADDIRKVTGLRALSFSENGFRSFTNSKHEVRTPADMVGLKIRTMESPTYIKLVQALGASATPIAAGELIMSLSQGVVDGQENAPSVVHDFGIADVQKFMSLDEHVMGVHILLMNEEIFAALDEPSRHTVIDAAQVFAATEDSEKGRSTQQYIDKIRAKGVAVHVTTPAEKDAFRQKAQKPVLDFITERVGKELVDALTAAVKDAEVRLYGL